MSKFSWRDKAKDRTLVIDAMLRGKQTGVNIALEQTEYRQLLVRAASLYSELELLKQQIFAAKSNCLEEHFTIAELTLERKLLNVAKNADDVNQARIRSVNTIAKLRRMMNE